MTVVCSSSYFVNSTLINYKNSIIVWSVEAGNAKNKKNFSSYSTKVVFILSIIIGKQYIKEGSFIEKLTGVMF